MATYNTRVPSPGPPGASHTSPYTFTVPAGVATGDVMLVGINCFSFDQTTPAFSTPTSGGGSWTQIGTIQYDVNASVAIFGTAWYRIATASDAGSTFSISYTGSVGADQFWWNGCLESYTGFDTASPIAQSGQNGGAGFAIGNTPSLSTLRPGSWAVYFAPITPNGSSPLTGVPSGTTQRHISNNNAGVQCASSDSNGSVGAAGTAIGGAAVGKFTTGNATDNWFTQWTIELAVPQQSAISPPQQQLTLRQIRRRPQSLLPTPPPAAAVTPAPFYQPGTVRAHPPASRSRLR